MHPARRQGRRAFDPSWRGCASGWDRRRPVHDLLGRLRRPWAGEAAVLTLGRADRALYDAKARQRGTDVEAEPRPSPTG